MKVLIFGGTTEGRILAGKLSERGFRVTVSVATPVGAEELAGTDAEVLTGRLGENEIEQLAAGFDLVVDATHPYAVIVSSNIVSACEKAHVPLKKIQRESSAVDDPDVVRVESCAEAAEYLKDKTGNILLTTGSKDLRSYRGIDPERLFPRVLPVHGSIDICEELNIPHRNILALQGPFTLEMNTAMMKQYRIRYMVTKDGGAAGGYPEKREAAERAGVTLVLVGRPPGDGLSLERVLEELETKPE